MRVFLTGGTGLLGSHLAERLTRSGHEVTALVRQGSDTVFLESVGCRLAHGDVRDTPEVLTPLLEGCTEVVHSAALVYAGGSWPAVREVNVEGTRNVLSAAVAAGVRRAVHVSSVAVYGRPDGPVNEDSPVDGPVPPSDVYARSKREAELVAREVAGDHGLSLSMVRPSAVYGERDRLLAPRVGRLVRYPITFTLGSGANTLPTVYAGNVAHALELVLERGADGDIYDVGLDHPLTQRALLQGIAAGLDRRVRFVAVPRGLVVGGADLLQALRIPTPGARDLPLGRVARLAVGENPYPSRRIRERLDWMPPYRHEEALVQTGRWLRSHK